MIVSSQDESATPPTTYVEEVSRCVAQSVVVFVLGCHLGYEIVLVLVAGWSWLSALVGRKALFSVVARRGHRLVCHVVRRGYRDAV